MKPTDAALNFNTGNQSGAPISAGAEAISAFAASPVHTAPPPLNTPFETIAPPAPVFETAHAVAAPIPDISQVGAAAAEVAQPVVTPTPAAAAAPSVPAPATAAPVAMPGPTPPGGLIGYGADLRPPAPTPPTTPPMAPAAPGSAPVNPSGGAGPTGQPAVVRQNLSAGTPLAAPGLTERALAATATGAAAGATAAHRTAGNRLARLLAAVAGQQPNLRWAIGDLEDGSTVLTTDLAGGWIPPDIDIPTGVRLLKPGARRGNLTALLGSTTPSVTYEPGRYLSPNDEPVAMSIRARETGAVNDLGWELSQATKWRDGLPRLAHTLAKAASSKTGCLDSEVALLREHLNTVGRSVLTKYPASDLTEVGNWQLLATIDALIKNEKILANYHFAWFRAQAPTREGYR